MISNLFELLIDYKIINYYSKGLDGQRVIIFGGAEADNIPVPSHDALYVLDWKNMQWFIPNVSGQTPNSRYWHKANVVGTYMVISFGKCDFFFLQKFQLYTAI